MRFQFVYGKSRRRIVKEVYWHLLVELHALARLDSSWRRMNRDEFLFMETLNQYVPAISVSLPFRGNFSLYWVARDRLWSSGQSTWL
jgi:hypothetical protein